MPASSPPAVRPLLAAAPEPGVCPALASSRRRRGRLVTVLAAAAGTVAVLAVAVAHAAAAPADRVAAPGPTFPAPCTPAPGGGCLPDSPMPLPTPPGMPGPTPAPAPPSTPPVYGPTLPHPTPTPSPSPSPTPSPSASASSPVSAPAPSGPPVQAPEQQPGGVVGWVSRGISAAVDAFFRGLVSAALDPLLGLLGQTVLSTPTPDQIPRVGELWAATWQFTAAAYVLLVLAAGVTVMAHETVQTRYSAKQVAPRVVVGFLAAALSLQLAGQAIGFANAASAAVLGEGVDPQAAASALAGLVSAALNSSGGVFLVFLGLALAVMLVGLLVGYAVRVALTVVLIAAAPAALACFGLPQTEGVARWWCRAFGGVLAVQVGQSLCLAAALRVFLAPGGFTIFGPTTGGLANMVVTLALVYVLARIPFWVLGQVRGGGRSFLTTLVRSVVAYRILSLLGARGRGGRGPRGGRGSGGGPGRGGSPGGGGRRGPRPRPGGGGGDPYARPRTNASGQYLLPLAGLRRVPRPASPTPPPSGRPAGPRRRAAAGRQLRLPLDGQWPEDRPVLQRDGQYRLPIPVTRVPRPRSTPPAGQTPATPARRAGRGRQLQIPFDPYARLRPDRSGQYRLPLDGLTRRPRPAPAAPAAPGRPAGTARRPARPRQLPLDLPTQPAAGPAGRPHPRTPTTTARRQPPAAGGGELR